MRLYHFINRQYGLEAIQKQRLKVSLFSELNDPFEFLGPNLRDKNLRRSIVRMKEILSKKTGMLCMSNGWRNPLLWSHYADKHRGLCLGFDVDDAFFLPVEYSRERLDISSANFHSPTADELDLMLKIARLKFEHWQYEREYRAFVNLDERDSETGFYFFSFSSQLALKEIIVGANCNLERKELITRTERYPNSIDIIKARPAFKSFAVVERKNWTAGSRA